MIDNTFRTIAVATIAGITLMGLPTSTSAAPGINVTAMLSGVYGKYDRRAGCWYESGTDSVDHFCMRVEMKQSIVAHDGPRVYVAVVGYARSADDSEDGAHPTRGAVGLFVFGWKDGKP